VPALWIGINFTDQEAMNKAIKCCENYLNGNIGDARHQAKRLDGLEIRKCFVEVFGYSENKAVLTAEYLKGRDCWQEACDAE